MQKLSKCLASLALGALYVGAACAQSSNPMLEQAIEAARAKKSAELGLTTTPVRRPDADPALAPKPVRTSPALPKVWSISGLDSELTAEVLFAGKVHALSLSQDKVRVGPWRLVRLSTTAASFAYAPNNQRVTEQTKVIQASPPASPAEMQGYFQSPVMAAPDATPGAPSARPPLPPELMRPAMQP